MSTAFNEDHTGLSFFLNYAKQKFKSKHVFGRQLFVCYANQSSDVYYSGQESLILKSSKRTLGHTNRY